MLPVTNAWKQSTHTYILLKTLIILMFPQWTSCTIAGVLGVVSLPARVQWFHPPMLSPRSCWPQIRRLSPPATVCRRKRFSEIVTPRSPCRRCPRPWWTKTNCCWFSKNKTQNSSTNYYLLQHSNYLDMKYIYFSACPPPLLSSLLLRTTMVVVGWKFKKTIMYVRHWWY